MTTHADPTADWWTTTDVAAYLGVRVATVSTYRKRGQMPAPTQLVGRTHMWRPADVTAWHEGRPRPGVGGRPTGLPTSTAAARPAAQLGVPDESAWRVHDSRPLYENRWVTVGLSDVELPDGQRFEHHTVTLPPAAMVVLVDDELDQVLLLWRHRFVSDTWNWELPGGVVEAGEDPADTAARECEEETGYRPRGLRHLVSFEPMIGTVTSPHHVYASSGAERVGEPTETTEGRMAWHPLVDVPALVEAGQVHNAGALVGLLHVLALPRR